MKIHLIKSLGWLLVAVLGLLTAAEASGQIYTTLYSFTATSDYEPYTNNDGAYPQGGLMLSGNTLYGAAVDGGTNGTGALFAVSTTGAGFTNLHNFAALQTNAANIFTNGDGAYSFCHLIQSGGTLYGTAYGGGTNGSGTVFALNTNGTGFTVLHAFGSTNNPETTNSDGANPYYDLILSGNTLYGTATYGGSNGNGTVFAVSTNGTNFAVLHTFNAFGANYSNSDGAYPECNLILSGGTLYGTAQYGGSNGNGTVFALNTSGTIFTNLHSFPFTQTNAAGLLTNGDGAVPLAGLILSGNTLYGTTYYGGTNGNGSVFGLDTNGTGFANLHNFTSTNNPAGTNGDGANPVCDLILSSNTLYGTTFNGGANGNGTVFAVNTSGTNFAVVHTFTAYGSNYTNSEGASPEAGLVLSGNTMYGTAAYGGSNGSGTVFGIAFSPQLAIVPSGSNVVLTWQAGVAGFDYTGYALQSITNLAATNWSNVSPSPVMVNGQETFTNAVSGSAKFFRLSQ